MIEDPLVCQSTLKSYRDVRSIMNIYGDERIASCILFSVNNLKKNLLVANLPN
jgi:hypothetical protein